MQLLKEKEKAYKDETDSKVKDVKADIPDLESAGIFKRLASALPALAGLVTLAAESISGFCQGLNLNCIVIHELFITTKLPNDELTSIHT